jgi:hypothetical protein
MARAGAFVLALLGLPIAARGYQADLVPASGRVEAQEIVGVVSITGADGTVHVKIENVNDARGDSLTSDALTVALKLRVNGIRRRVTIPMTVDDGDGEVTASLGLLANDWVVVQDLRVRGPGHRTLAQAGALTRDVSTAPPVAPPTPSDCPAALESCQSDLEECATALDECESLE